MTTCLAVGLTALSIAGLLSLFRAVHHAILAEPAAADDADLMRFVNSSIIFICIAIALISVGIATSDSMETPPACQAERPLK